MRPKQICSRQKPQELHPTQIYFAQSPCTVQYTDFTAVGDLRRPQRHDGLHGELKRLLVHASAVQLKNERSNQPPALIEVNDAVIRVYDEAGNVIETQEHAGDFNVMLTYGLGLFS